MSSTPSAVDNANVEYGFALRGPSRGLCPAIADLASVEASFILFLFSGRYKMLPEFRWIPVDPTAIFLALTLVLIVSGLAFGRLKFPPLGVTGLSFLLFTEFAAISIFWSSLDPLNTDKLLRFMMLTVPSFFIAGILAQDPLRRLRMLRIIVWFSVGLVAYYYYYRLIVGVNLVSSNGDFVGRITAEGNTYLDYSSHAAIIFVVFLSSALLRSWTQFWLGLAGMGCILLALADIGGRGPLAMAIMAVPLAALATLLLDRSSSSVRLRLIVLIGLLGAGGLAFLTAAKVSESEFRTIDRYELQMSNEDTSSMDERTQGQALAYRLWLERPLFGWGIGEFRVRDSYLNYPHNLLLEILMELGLVGGVLFVVTIAGTAGRCIQHINHPDWNWVDASYAFLLATELAAHLTVQGYLAEDRIFFSYVAINLFAAFPSRLRLERS